MVKRLPSCFLLITLFFQLGAQTLTENHINLGGYDRQYFVYAPAGLEAGKEYPLILVLHGGGGHAKQIMGFCGFNPLADKEKFIAVYPDGYRKSWHDGRIAPDIDANQKNIDDVTFLKRAIEQVQSKFSIDPDRIFSTGISNGAMMSLHLAYKLSDKIRAIAPVCGSIAENAEKEFKPAHPIAVLVINGTEDTLVPYQGGPVLSKRANRGRVVSTDKMMNIWMALESGSGSPVIRKMADTDPSDKCTAERLTYPSMQNNPVELIRITGGGHTWPGGKQYLPKMIVGRVCRDFKAEVVIWNFFKNIPPR